MSSQQLLPTAFQREVSRLTFMNDDLALTILAREATIAARDARIAKLSDHRRTLFWLVIVLGIMLVVAMATGH